jgi:hypothetical protein
VADTGENFAAVDRHFARGREAQFDAIAMDFKYNDLDILADANRFLGFAA